MSTHLTRRSVMTGLAGAALLAFAGPARANTRRHAALARGFNLPDWVNVGEAGAPSAAVLDKLQAMGFGAVRLPIDADEFGLGNAATVRAAGARLEAVLTELTSRGIAVIADLHSSPRIGDLLAHVPDDGDRAVVRAWENLRPIIAGFSPKLVFPELFNEPPMEAERWLPLRDRLAETVRHACPDHTLIWGASRYQGIWETVAQPALPDPNAIAAVHYYTPMGFTHQCMSWGNSPLERIGDLPFPATREIPEVRALEHKLSAAGDSEALQVLVEEFAEPWFASRIEADFADLARWSSEQNCPVLLNEFGVLDFCVDPASRARWVRAVREAAEATCVGWTYWELDQGFGFIADRRSTEGFDMTLIEALLV